MNDNDLLKNAHVAAPCPADWGSMEGDDRVRFCSQCKLNVYNLTNMSSKEAAELVSTKEDRLCVRVYKRRDGTVITDNCPVGLRKVRDRARTLVAVCVAFFSWIGVPERSEAQNEPLQGQLVCPTSAPSVQPVVKNHASDLRNQICIGRVGRMNAAIIVSSSLIAFAFGSLLLWRRRQASIVTLGGLAAVILVAVGLAWGLQVIEFMY